MKTFAKETESWYSKKHSDIVSSCWISDDTRNLYKGLICEAFEDGQKENLQK